MGTAENFKKYFVISKVCCFQRVCTKAMMQCFFLCRSFGVVLWEILTKEIPYKDVDSSAIIWGVGSNSLHLPVPDTCPDGFQLLMRQCWLVSNMTKVE